MMTAKTVRFLMSSLSPLLWISSPRMAKDNAVWSLDGTYRLRYESLHNAYRAGASGSDQILASRLLASLKRNGEHLFGELEIQDSRSWLDDAGTPLGTDDVNALEPLQAWIGWREQDRLAIKAGRLTLDIGSRRFVARNRFRNTLNAFDGVYGNYRQDA